MSRREPLWMRAIELLRLFSSQNQRNFSRISIMAPGLQPNYSSAERLPEQLRG
jgi:hypothetical protein